MIGIKTDTLRNLSENHTPVLRSFDTLIVGVSLKVLTRNPPTMAKSVTKAYIISRDELRLVLFSSGWVGF